MRITSLITAIAALVLTGLFAAPAQAALPTGRTYDDGVQSGASYDITKVNLYSANAGEPATMLVAFAADPEPMDTLTVWFNTDKDAKPEMVLYASAYSNYLFREYGTGRELSCGSASLTGKNVSIEFGPSCVATSKTMTVAVKAVDAERKGRDKVGSPKAWPKRVKSYL